MKAKTIYWSVGVLVLVVIFFVAPIAKNPLFRKVDGANEYTTPYQAFTTSNFIPDADSSAGVRTQQ